MNAYFGLPYLSSRSNISVSAFVEARMIILVRLGRGIITEDEAKKLKLQI